jgi:iron complex transport system substrate-binding protein
MSTPRRICSLLPSATEIVCALGLADRLVAVTHECDFPAEVRTKPQVTSSVIDSSRLAAKEIDQAVRDSLEENATIYRLDRDILDRLHPDLILTQELCTVCAVGTNEVRRVVHSLSADPLVVSLEPTTLEEVLDSILAVGRLTGTLRRAIELRSALCGRLDAVRDAVSDELPVPVLTMEWTDPLFVGGHWVPEMVSIAGGRDVLGRPGEPSRVASWQEVVAAQPEVIIAMPCGFGLERSAEELKRALPPPEWYALPAVQRGKVYVVDGSSYFNRPGPRLVDGVEILASILHPDAWSAAPAGSFALHRVYAEAG